MIRVILLALTAAIAFGLPGLAADAELEPADLVKRPDLIGGEITVEDRVRLFQFHPGQGYDELLLKRTPVVFRLPPRLREIQARNPRAVRVQGTLKREQDGLVCEVTAVEPFPEDLQRVNRAVAALPAQDFVGRTTWARWAEKRGRAFRDDRLLARATELEADAIRIESERPASDPAKHWLSLAERARIRHVAEPEPSALAHPGLLALLKEAKTADAFAAVLERIEHFLPASNKVPATREDLEKWAVPYQNNPSAAYRAAPAPVRSALDRRLWADAAQRLLELQAAADPSNALALADKADSQLPDRPEVAARLVEQALQSSTRDLAKLRLSEVESLAKLYRDRLRQPDRVQTLYRDWLSEQRKNRLRPTDAEGRILLANQYETLLGDRDTAAALLKEAWKIDPDSKDLADAFLRKGYRKVDGQWVGGDQPRPRSAPSAEVAETPQPDRGPQLRGSTPQDVRERLGGKPDRVVRSMSRGQCVEQWIYYGSRQVQYVNFLYSPGESRPRVIASYSRPLSTVAAPAPR